MVQYRQPGGIDGQPIVQVGCLLSLMDGIAFHSWTKQHQVDWEAAKTIEVEETTGVLEALHIHERQQTSNLDCGLTINPSWLPVLPTM